MTTLQLAAEQLAAADYSIMVVDDSYGPYLMFESDTVLGFVLGYADAATLIERWRLQSQHILKTAQFGLRRAEVKAWNAYLILLAEAAADYGPSVTLSTIEEDLTGTRKIARAGIVTDMDARGALLPLLSMQHAPQLDAVDMAAEVRLRTSELPVELIDAFVSGAADTALLQLLEGGQ